MDDDNRYESDDDDGHFLDSDFSSEEDQSVDIVSTEQEERKAQRCDDDGGANKFSIDRILGLSRKCKDDKCDEGKVGKEVKFIKPTPLPAAPRAG